jgi:hypothetical protein
VYRHLLSSSVGIATIGLTLALSGAPASSAIVMQSPIPVTGHAYSRFGRVKAAANFTFMTINNPADPTFNQLMGINNAGTICGSYGSGAPGHPMQGYCVTPPYAQANFVSENYPGSAQTQVVAIDNIGNTAGLWIDGANTNFGFIQWNGVFTTYVNPKTKKGTTNQLLALNDNGIAAGYYQDKNGVDHAYSLNQNSGVFTKVVPPNAAFAQATGIDNAGDVTGFLFTPSMNVLGWLLRKGSFSSFSFPGATVTVPGEMNNKDQIVGSYADAAGHVHGFLVSHPLTNPKWDTIDQPDAVGGTTVNGINDLGELVGYYNDRAGNLDGFLATPT